MKNIKTFESYTKDNHAVIDIFGPDDYNQIIEVNRDLLSPGQSLMFDTIEIRYLKQSESNWRSNIKPGSVFVMVTKTIPSVPVNLISQTGFIVNADEVVRIIGVAPNFPPLHRTVSPHMFDGITFTLSVLCDYGKKPDNNIGVYNLAKALMKENGGPTDMDNKLGEKLIRVANNFMSKGQTPTRLLSIIRTKFPQEYEAEFGKDDIAADMGDLGF
jgi:hypothetical protein